MKILVIALDEHAPPRPVPSPIWVWWLRPVVYALVLAARLPFIERLYWNPDTFRQVANP